MSDIFEILDGTPEEQTYLRVDEQSNYIDVYCDGFVFRVYVATTTTLARVYDTNLSNYLVTVNQQFFDGVYSYNFYVDPNRKTEIIENTSTRVQIRTVGNFYNGTQGYLTNSTSFNVIFTIYKDRVSIDSEWIVSDTISLTSSLFRIFGLYPNTSFTSNRSWKYENSGIESTPTNYTNYDSSDYYSLLADEVDVLFGELSNNLGLHQRYESDTNGFCLSLSSADTSISAGTYNISCFYIIDSAQREYGIQKYTETDRLVMGDQYKDLLLDTVDSSVLFQWDCSDVDNLPSGLTKSGSPTNSEGGLLCDASGEIIQMATAGRLDISKGVIEFDMKPLSIFADNSERYYFGIRGATSNPGEIRIYKSSGNLFYFVIVDSDTIPHYINWSVTELGSNWSYRWKHFRFEWDSTNPVSGSVHLRLELDGVYIAPNASSAAYESWTDATLAANIGIGNDYENTVRPANGIIKNLIIGNDPSVEILRKPTTGLFVQDSRIPANIPSYQSTGFAADGAHHIESANDIVKITWDRTRINPSVVIEDFGFKTGIASNDSSVLFQWDCSDVDDLPSGLTKVGSPTNSEGGLLCDASGEMITMLSSGRIDISKGVIEFEFKSLVSFTDNTEHVIFGAHGTSNTAGDIVIRKSSVNNLDFMVVGSGDTIHLVRYNTGVVVNGWLSMNHFRFIWDSTNVVYGTVHLALYYNGEYVSPDATTGWSSPWTDATIATTLGIGNDPDKSGYDYQANGIIRNLYIGNDPTVDILHPTDHLVAHWKMDDNEASTTIVDALGNYDGTASTNTENLSVTDAIKGNAFQLVRANSEYLDLSSSLAGLTTLDEFSVLIKFKPELDYDTANDHGIFHVYYGNTNVVSLIYRQFSDAIQMNTYVDNTLYQRSVIFTENNSLRQFHTVLISIDLTKNMLVFVFDGEVISVDFPTNEWFGDPTQFYVGRANPAVSSTVYGDIIADDVKLFNGCLLPFGGGPFVGNGEVDVNLAHSDVLFYWDCESTSVNIGDKTVSLNGASISSLAALIGTNGLLIDADNESAVISYTSHDVFDLRKGSLSFWVKPSGSHVLSESLFKITDDTSGYIQVSAMTDTTQLNCYYLIGGVANSFTSITGALVSNVWNYFRFEWEENKLWRAYRNGILIGQDTSVSGDFSGSASGVISIGNSAAGSWNTIEGYYDQIFITNNPNTPDRWSVMGKPLHQPLLEVV